MKIEGGKFVYEVGDRLRTYDGPGTLVEIRSPDYSGDGFYLPSSHRREFEDLVRRRKPNRNVRPFADSSGVISAAQ